MMSHKDLNIWKMAREVTIDVHKMALKQLPSFEKFETASQIRHSSKSVRLNIVEGYGRRCHKEYIRFLIFAFSKKRSGQMGSNFVVSWPPDKLTP